VKRSKDYYLTRLTKLVETVRSGKKAHINNIPNTTRVGILEVFDEYLFHKWTMIGDKSFNRDGYRNATDQILQELKKSRPL